MTWIETLILTLIHPSHVLTLTHPCLSHISISISIYNISICLFVVKAYPCNPSHPLALTRCKPSYIDQPCGSAKHSRTMPNDCDRSHSVMSRHNYMRKRNWQLSWFSMESQTVLLLHRSLYTQSLLHTNTFTHKHFYTQTLLHTDAFYTQTLLHRNTFTHRRFYTQTLLHTDAFTHRRFYTQKLLHTEAFTHNHFYTQTLLHTETLIHRDSYTQTLLHTDAVTHSHFYTQTLLHTDASTHQTLLHTDAFTHRSFYAQKLLHTNTFTHTQNRNFSPVFGDRPSFRAKGLLRHT